MKILKQNKPTTQNKIRKKIKNIKTEKQDRDWYLEMENSKNFQLCTIMNKKFWTNLFFWQQTTRHVLEIHARKTTSDPLILFSTTLGKLIHEAHTKSLVRSCELNPNFFNRLIFHFSMFFLFASEDTLATGRMVVVDHEFTDSLACANADKTEECALASSKLPRARRPLLKRPTLKRRDQIDELFWEI